MGTPVCPGFVPLPFLGLKCRWESPPRAGLRSYRGPAHFRLPPAARSLLASALPTRRTAAAPPSTPSRIRSASCPGGDHKNSARRRVDERCNLPVGVISRHVSSVEAPHQRHDSRVRVAVKRVPHARRQKVLEQRAQPEHLVDLGGHGFEVYPVLVLLQSV